MMGLINVFVVASLFLNLKQNMTLVAAGQAFMSLKRKNRLMNFLIIHYPENEQKFDAVNAMPT